MRQTKNLWSVICKRLIVDEQTKLITLVDIVERLIVDVDVEKAPPDIQKSFKNGRFEKPIQITDNITIASYWELQKEHRGVELRVETVIKDENDNELFSGMLSFETNAEHTNYRTFFTVSNFPVTGKGIYHIESRLKNSKDKVLAKGEVPITIDLNNIKTK